MLHIYCSFHKYEVHKFKLLRPFVVPLARMSGSAHRAGGNLAEGSIKYNERNRNVYLGKVCAQMYTMKTRGNKPNFSKNERKCAATYTSYTRGITRNQHELSVITTHLVSVVNTYKVYNNYM